MKVHSRQSRRHATDRILTQVKTDQSPSSIWRLVNMEVHGVILRAVLLLCSCAPMQIVVESATELYVNLLLLHKHYDF